MTFAPAIQLATEDLVDDSHDLICTHDLDGRILSANIPAARLFGVAANGLRGLRIQDLLVPAVRSGFDKYIATIRRDGHAKGSMTIQGAGGVRVLEYHNTLKTEGNQPVVRGLARDVTERENAIRALAESEAHFRSITENVSDLITIVDRDATIRYSSPSIRSLLGYSPEEMKGRSFFDLVDADDELRAIEFLERQSVSHEPSAVELRLRHCDGSMRYVETVAKTLMRGNRVAGAIATTRDITDRRRLEAQLERANRLSSLGRLAATVAHEFNNVLMGMQPFAELMQRHSASREVVAKGSWHIANSIARGKRIVQDILRFTQPAEPILRSIDIREWWQTLLPEIEALSSNDTTIVSELPREPLHIRADAAQLTQAITNLVTNARDAMPKGGTMTFRAERPTAGETYPFGVVAHPEDFVHLSLSDTGCGIAEEMLHQVFEPLFTSKPNGTGLGLAVAHQVVMRHGGHIFVESSVGRGTTFHLFLGAAEVPAAIEIDGAPELSAIRARKLLIVDDETAIVEGIAALLRDCGFDVSSVGSGEEALDAVGGFTPDVVLLDVGLPGIDGVETSRRLRARHPALPIIFSSGHASDAGPDECTQYLQKPFALDALIDAIAALEAAA